MNLPASFSDREKEVAALLLRGLSNKQIAQELGVSTRTAEFHISNIYAKLGVSSRAEAIIKLAQANLRESTGENLRESGGDLRGLTVEKTPDSSDNRDKFIVSIRRITMRKILFAIAAVIGVVILALVAVLVWNLPGRNAGGQASPVAQQTGVAFTSTQTPYQTLAPSRTPYQTAAPTHTPWVTPTVPESGPVPLAQSDGRFNADGVSFAYEPDLMLGASAQVFPAVPASQDVPYWEVLPEYVKFQLIGYPQGIASQTPTISVYPVDEYASLAPQAAETLANLKQFLAQRPEAGDQIPFVPIWNSGQVFHSNLKYLDFANGSGVRFLAIYAQYPAPVNNADIFYTYQGLTSDGRYAISVILPVDHPSLPADLNAVPVEQMDAIVKEYNTYRSDAAAALEAEPDGSFSPDLSRLDALVASLSVDR